MKLFCPGPININSNVINALINPIISHRTSDFRILFKECQDLTLQLFNTSIDQYTPLFITGSGTLTIECMIYSHLYKKKVLLITNGYFGEKWELILKNYSSIYDCLSFDWNIEIDYDKLEQTLCNNTYDIIFFVHHETSTTMINNLHEIYEISKKYSVKLAIDCVSSVGLYNIDLSLLTNIDILTYSSNKCILSYPGLSVAMVKNTILLDMDDRLSYLNLKIYDDYAKKYETPFTPCVQNFFAYKTALTDILYNGINKLFNTSENLMAHLINNLKLIDIYPSITNISSRCIWVCNFKCTDPTEIYNKLYDKNYIIYKCKGILEDTCIQISILNKTIEDIDDLIKEIKEIKIQKNTINTQYFIDGCFDGYHYGHVNAIFQSKKLCDILVLGTHNNEEMTIHKNIPIIDYSDRCTMLSYCKFIDNFVGAVPYITNLQTVHRYNCSKYLHGEELIITKNNENGIQIPDEYYITYKVTEGISTTNLLLRLYQYTYKLLITQNNNYEYLTSIINKMKDYMLQEKLKKDHDCHKTDNLYLYHSWDLLCPIHVNHIQSIKNEYPNYNIIAIIKKNDTINNTEKYIFNELERFITLYSITLIDDVILEDELNNNETYNINKLGEFWLDLTDCNDKYYLEFDKSKYISKIMENFEQFKYKISKYII